MRIATTPFPPLSTLRPVRPRLPGGAAGGFHRVDGAGSQAVIIREESTGAVYVPYQAVFRKLPPRIVIKPLPVLHGYPQISGNAYDVFRGDERLVPGAADPTAPALHRLRIF